MNIHVFVLMVMNVCEKYRNVLCYIRDSYNGHNK